MDQDHQEEVEEEDPTHSDALSRTLEEIQVEEGASNPGGGGGNPGGGGGGNPNAMDKLPPYYF